MSMLDDAKLNAYMLCIRFTNQLTAPDGKLMVSKAELKTRLVSWLPKVCPCAPAEAAEVYKEAEAFVDELTS